MKERPILFSGAMVRAILDGRKSQTRRVWTMPRGLDWFVSGCMCGEETGDIHDPTSSWWGHVEEMACPHGQVGDRLYVREAWRTLDYLDPYSGGHIGVMSQVAGYANAWAPIQYEADSHRHRWEHTSTPPHSSSPQPGRYRHARFMPRWASRIFLEITAVRVERLQEISEEGALAEGVFKAGPSGTLPIGQCVERVSDGLEVVYMQRGMARDEYRWLWDSINGKTAWAGNPWVWVIEFRRVV